MPDRRPSLLRRLFWPRTPSGEVIPPGTRVDPDKFDESEYPVHCPKCAYALRGLTSNRCPECGKAFDRGELLVQQYAGGRVMTHKSKRHRKVQQVGWVGVLVVSVSPLVVALAVSLFPAEFMTWSRAHPSLFAVLLRIGIVVMVAGFGAVVVVGVVGWRAERRLRPKRAAVAEAIDRNDARFRLAQIPRRTAHCIQGAVYACFLLLFYDDLAECWRYVANLPGGRLLMLAQVALIFFIAALVVVDYRRRRRNQPATLDQTSSPNEPPDPT